MLGDFQCFRSVGVSGAPWGCPSPPQRSVTLSGEELDGMGRKGVRERKRGEERPSLVI